MYVYVYIYIYIYTHTSRGLGPLRLRVAPDELHAAPAGRAVILILHYIVVYNIML